MARFFRFCIAEYDAGNAVIRTYTRGLDLSGSLQGAGGIGGLLAMTNAAGNAYSYFCDGNGNVVDLTDGYGAIGAHYQYDPFGNQLAATGTVQQPYQWSSKETDASTGLVSYLYRFYNPALGRWLNRDPLDQMGSPANSTSATSAANADLALLAEATRALNALAAKQPGMQASAPLENASEIGSIFSVLRTKVLSVSDTGASELADVNSYASCGNDPLNGTDALGLRCPSLVSRYLHRLLGDLWNDLTSPWTLAKMLGNSLNRGTFLSDLANGIENLPDAAWNGLTSLPGMLNSPEGLADLTNIAGLLSVGGGLGLARDADLAGEAGVAGGTRLAVEADSAGEVGVAGEAGATADGSPALFHNQFPEDTPVTPTIIPQGAYTSPGYTSTMVQYVVTENGELIVGQGGHIDLAKGAPVQAAGEVRFTNGQVSMLNDSSGHYQATGASAQAAAENAFKQAGLPVSPGTYKSYNNLNQ